jgi:hypothetical protein
VPQVSPRQIPVPVPVNLNKTLQRTSSNSSIQSSSRSGKNIAQPPILSQVEEKEIETLISRGYTWDQAQQMVTKKCQADKDNISCFNRSSISSVTESSKVRVQFSTKTIVILLFISGYSCTVDEFSNATN